MANKTTPGHFVWHDLYSTDLDASRAFFTKLFGWTIERTEMGGSSAYEMVKVGDGRAFGGINQLENGGQSYWVSYTTTPDIDAFIARASELGATVNVPAWDVPEVGRMAFLSDPQGAVFAPFTDATDPHYVPEVPLPAHGTVGWHELATTDPQAAVAFYSVLFNWNVEVMDVGTGPYNVIKAGDAMLGGIMRAVDGMPVAAWVIYFTVDDVDATIERVVELGGTVIAPVFQVPTVGKLAWAADPAGAVFAVATWEMPA